MKKSGLILALVAGFMVVKAQDGPNICVYNKLSNYSTGGGPGELEEGMKCSDEAITIEALQAKPKTWFYRGELYTIVGEDTVLRKTNATASLEAVKAFKKLAEMNDPKFKEWKDAIDHITALSTDIYNGGVDQFQKYKNYPLAYQYFMAVKDVKDILKSRNKDLPSNIDLNLALRFAGQSAENSGDTAKAIACYQEALSATKDSLVFLRYVRILKSSGKVDEAKKAVNEALALYPNNAPLRVEKINFFLELEQYTEALADINQLIAVEPKNDGAYLIKGLAYNKMGIEDSVIYCYTKATEINPKNGKAFYNLGAWYVTKANNLGKEMNKLSSSAEDSKKYDAMKKQCKELYLKAKPFIEKAAALDPSDQQIKRTLKQIELYTAE